MSHKNREILEGAFIISDAHYSKLRPELLLFIKAIHSKRLQPTQLILMGDIFDALFGGIKDTEKENEQLVVMLNEISEDIELIYMEGNHDFNLKKVFSKADVFRIGSQPIAYNFKGKKLLLAHGDFDGATAYRLYTALIRNPIVLGFLQLLDSLGNHFILKRLDALLEKKDDCNEFTEFREYIEKRQLQKYGGDYFIEGHYHQNRCFDLPNLQYINLAAFACNQRYFIVKSSNDTLYLYEEKFSKGE